MLSEDADVNSESAEDVDDDSELADIVDDVDDVDGVALLQPMGIVQINTIDISITIFCFKIFPPFCLINERFCFKMFPPFLFIAY